MCIRDSTSDEQPKKASVRIVATLVGIVTDTSDEHDWKAWVPIVATLVGIVTAVSE